MVIKVESVTVLQAPVGNMWDVFKNNRRIGRVTYHGNTLIEIKRGIFGNPWEHTTKAKVEEAIKEHYNG